MQKATRALPTGCGAWSQLLAMYMLITYLVLYFYILNGAFVVRHCC